MVASRVFLREGYLGDGKGVRSWLDERSIDIESGGSIVPKFVSENI